MARYGYIAHHGIEGQKWGRRNGPPYPLAPGAHSAEEKRKTGGHYSQGVKQDRSGGSSGGSGGSSNYNSQAAMERRFMEEQAKKEKRKKIARAVAVGVGLTAATAAIASLAAVGIAGYAGVSTMRANPDTTNAVLKGIGSMVAGKLGDMKSLSNARKEIFADKRLTPEGQNFQYKGKLDFTKAQSAKRKADFIDSFKKARNSDKERRGLLPIDLDKDDKETIINRASKNIRLIKGKEDAIVDKFGVKTLDQIAQNSKKINNARNRASSDAYNYKQTHGIRGAINKGRKAYSIGKAGFEGGKKAAGVGITVGSTVAGMMGLQRANQNQGYNQGYNPNQGYNNRQNQGYNQNRNNQNGQNRQPRYEYYYDSKGRVQRRAK